MVFAKNLRADPANGIVVITFLISGLYRFIENQNLNARSLSRKRANVFAKCMASAALRSMDERHFALASLGGGQVLQHAEYGRDAGTAAKQHEGRFARFHSEVADRQMDGYCVALVKGIVEVVRYEAVRSIAPLGLFALDANAIIPAVRIAGNAVLTNLVIGKARRMDLD